VFPVLDPGYPACVGNDPLQEAEPFRGYADEPRPLGSYAAIAGIFGGVFGTLLINAARTGRLPERVAAADVLALGIGSYRVSRLVARDTVTSFLRAPFTSFEGQGGISELNESPRGGNVRRAFGELVGCPKCLDQWVAAGFFAGLLYAPGATRVIAALFGSVAVADFLQLAYAAAQKRSE
jgi:Protein of unknown function (DUF1360)